MVLQLTEFPDSGQAAPHWTHSCSPAPPPRPGHRCQSSSQPPGPHSRPLKQPPSTQLSPCFIFSQMQSLWSLGTDSIGHCVPKPGTQLAHCGAMGICSKSGQRYPFTLGAGAAVGGAGTRWGGAVASGPSRLGPLLPAPMQALWCPAVATLQPERPEGQRAHPHGLLTYLRSPGQAQWWPDKPHSYPGLSAGPLGPPPCARPGIPSVDQ